MKQILEFPSSEFHLGNEVAYATYPPADFHSQNQKIIRQTEAQSADISEMKFAEGKSEKKVIVEFRKSGKSAGTKIRRR